MTLLTVSADTVNNVHRKRGNFLACYTCRRFLIVTEYIVLTNYCTVLSPDRWRRHNHWPWTCTKCT